MHPALLRPRFRPRTAVFDGANDYLTRGAGLTGAAAGKQGTVSFWVRCGNDGSLERVLFSTNNRFGVRKKGLNLLGITLDHDDGTDLLEMNTTTTFTAASPTRHVIAAWDLGAGLAQMYVDGAPDATISTGPVDDTIDYVDDDWAIGATTSGTQLLAGLLADFWFDTTFLDLRYPQNRHKFRSYQGDPVNLGNTGERVLGRPPLVYCSLRRGDASAASFADNRGSGGGFTVNGALAAGSEL